MREWSQLKTNKARPLWVRLACVYDPYLSSIAQQWPINHAHEAFRGPYPKRMSARNNSLSYLVILFYGLYLLGRSNTFRAAMPSIVNALSDLSLYLMILISLYSIPKMTAMLCNQAPSSTQAFFKSIQTRAKPSEHLVMVNWDTDDIFHVHYIEKLKTAYFALILAGISISIITGVLLSALGAGIVYLLCVASAAFLIVMAHFPILVNSYVLTPRASWMSVKFPMSNEEWEKHLLYFYVIPIISAFALILERLPK